MATEFTVIINAMDRSANAFKSAGNNLMKLEQQLAKANQSIPRMGEVESFVKRSSLVTGALAFGATEQVIKLASAIAQIEPAWANAVRGVSNKSLTLGIDTKQLFGIRNAAKSVGLSEDLAQSSAELISRGFYDASQGRDPTKRAIYQAYDITGKDVHGNFSPEALLEEIAAAGERVNRQNGPFARHRLFELLGADGLEDLLNKGQKGVRFSYNQNLPLVPTDADIQRANEYADAMSKLGIQFDMTKTTILSGVAPALTNMLTDLNTFLDRVNTGKPTPTRNAGSRVADVLEAVGNGIRGNGYRTNAERDAAIGSIPPLTRAFGMGRSNVTQETNAFFAELERRNNLPRGLLDSVWAKESGRSMGGVPAPAPFMPDSDWPSQSIEHPPIVSHKGAIGPFQFMPNTARQYGLKDPNNFEASATAAAAYLGDLLRITGGSLPMALASYNWGQGNLNKYGLDRAPRETRRYVADITDALSQLNVPRENSGRVEGLYPNPKIVEITPGKAQPEAPAQQPGQLTVKVELGNLPAGSRTSVSSSPNVTSSVTSGSTGRTDQFALGATY